MHVYIFFSCKYNNILLVSWIMAPHCMFPVYIQSDRQRERDMTIWDSQDHSLWQGKLIRFLGMPVGPLTFSQKPPSNR